MTTARGHREARARRDPEVSSRILAAVRSKNTRPELVLRSALHRAGLRFRIHVTGLPGTPDVVFPRTRLAVFVDGDYWHGRSWRSRGFTSLEDQFARWQRGDWWLAKIRGNIRRDRRQNRALRRAGWRVIRVRDSVVLRDPLAVVAKVRTATEGGT